MDNPSFTKTDSSENFQGIYRPQPRDGAVRDSRRLEHLFIMIPLWNAYNIKNYVYMQV